MRYHAAVWRPRLSVALLMLSAAVPFVAAAEDAQPGRQLYLQYCSACHGRARCPYALTLGIHMGDSL